MSAHYHLTIGDKNYSSWSLRPWLTMKMANIPFTETRIALRRPETAECIKALSPSGKVPLLTIQEQDRIQHVWDSLAICETLAERHPDAKLWPKNARERAHARAIVAEMHSGFADVRRVLPMELARRLPTPELDETLRTQIARITALWTDVLERSQGPFLFGNFGIADAFYAPVATRFDTYGIVLSPVARDYCARIFALEPMRAWISDAKAEAATA